MKKIETTRLGACPTTLEAIRLISYGMSFAECARYMDKEPEMIRTRIKRHSPELYQSVRARPSPNRIHSDAVITAVRAHWDAGRSISDIAWEMRDVVPGINRDKVVGIAHRNNFPPRPSPIKRAS